MSTFVLAGLAPLVFGGFVTVVVLALGLALFVMAAPKAIQLEDRISGYALGAPGMEVDPTKVGDQSLAESALMQRLVGLTGSMAERAGLLTRVEAALEQADLPLRPPEALFFHVAGALVAGMIGGLLFGPLAGLVLLLLGAMGPFVYLHRRRVKRLRRFQVQLPDTLTLLSGSMRAGFSFVQGLEAVANEASEPTRRELQRVFTESRLGRPIEDALEDSAQRMNSMDLAWAVMAIRIQREVGGNLAELLDTVAYTMTQRERIRHEIFALTAEGRMSAVILGVFPPGFAGVLFMVQPDYIGSLFKEPTGIIACIVSAVMAGIGFVWLKKIMDIET